MDNFVNKLKDIEVEPHSSNWLKLENRLYEDTFYTEPKKNHTFWYKAIGLTAIVLLAISSLFYIRLQPSNSLNALEGFVMEEISSYKVPVDGIYNITMLQKLNKAYTKQEM